MASKEVVNERARSQLQHVLRELSEERGGLRLALLESTGLPDRWGLLLSAPWMDALGPRSIISDLTSRLLRRVDKKFLSVIDHVSVMPSSDPFVRAFTTMVSGFLGVDPSTHPGGFPVHDLSIEGRDVVRGFVFAADPRSDEKPKGFTATRKLVVR